MTTDFEAGASGWSHDKMDGVSGSWTFDAWEHGTATSGPGACHSGSGCWATNLDGNYVQCQRAELRSPVIDVSACASEEIRLSFYHAYDFWTGDYGGTTWFDGGFVEISGDGGSTWHQAGSYPGTVAINPNMGSSYACLNANQFYADGRPGYVGVSAGWTVVEIPIEPQYRTSQLRVRFVYATGVSYPTTSQAVSMQHARPGWYVDDVAVVLP